MTYFICQSEFSVSRERLFSFHEGPDGFRILVGLSKGIEVISSPKSLSIGELAIMRIPVFPLLKVKWIAKHIEYERNVLFTDMQMEGPFQIFKHRHKFRALTEDSCVLTDEIEVQFWFWPVTRWFLLPILKKQFQARHKSTAEFLGCKQKLMFCGYSISIID